MWPRPSFFTNSLSMVDEHDCLIAIMYFTDLCYFGNKKFPSKRMLASRYGSKVQSRVGPPALVYFWVWSICLWKDKALIENKTPRCQIYLSKVYTAAMFKNGRPNRGTEKNEHAHLCPICPTTILIGQFKRTAWNTGVMPRRVYRT